MRAVLLVACLGSACGQADLEPALKRISEEAEVFRRMAPRTLAEETLQQKAVRGSPLSYPRMGTTGAQARPRVVQTRTLVSEYGLGTFEEPGKEQVLHEFRKVISVDGRTVNSVEQARHALSLGMRSPDDRVRKRLLEEFKRYGLLEAVTDFAPMILLFTKRGIQNYEFTPAGQSRVGGERTRIVNYRQVGGTQSVVVFQKRKVVRRSMQGQIFVRSTDGLPLRITLQTSHEDDGHRFRNEAAVEYTMSAHGFLAPASVVHREYIDDEVQQENIFGYSPFRLFSADAEIKFTELPSNP